MSLDNRGNLLVRKYYSSAGAATDGIIWSPSSGKKWVLTDLVISTVPASTIYLEDDVSTGDSSLLAIALAANGGICKRFKSPLVSAEANADLLVTTTGAGAVYICATGYEV
jgi:hypothetical protein